MSPLLGSVLYQLRPRKMGPCACQGAAAAGRVSAAADLAAFAATGKSIRATNERSVCLCVEKDRKAERMAGVRMAEWHDTTRHE
ncbi:hypothetical protein H4217_008043 [Coemansia sp. RSA 1939]|nr:hypothetical protein H4217_008043 [Coemansia sp. RSA 1939]